MRSQPFSWMNYVPYAKSKTPYTTSLEEMRASGEDLGRQLVQSNLSDPQGLEFLAGVVRGFIGQDGEGHSLDVVTKDVVKPGREDRCRRFAQAIAKQILPV